MNGLRILNEAIPQILLNVQSNIENDIEKVAKIIDTRKKFKLEKLQNELAILKLSIENYELKKLIFLKEQFAISKALNIEGNIMENQSSQKEFKVNLNINESPTPYYLRGYIAIDEEISLIEERTNYETLLMANKYIELKGKILSTKSSLFSSQLRTASKIIANDDPNRWIKIDLRFINTELNKKSIMLYLVFSIVLGGLIGVIYVLISNAFRKRKEYGVKT